MVIKERYKQTEIGVIPKDWEVKKLGIVSDITKLAGFEYSLHFNSYNDGGDIIVVRGTNITHNKMDLSDVKNIPTSTSNKLQRSKLFKNDLVFAYVGTIGPVYLIEEDNKYHLGPNTSKITVKKELFSKFVYHYFTSGLLKKEIVEHTSIGAQPSLSMSKIRSFRIIVPPTLKEQTAIANALSDADGLITGLEKLIAKKRNIKQGAMQQLLQPKEGWGVKKLGEVAHVIMGQSPLSKFYNTESIGLPLIQGNADINNRKTIIRSYTSSVTKKGKAGDIIMSVRAPVGEISRATFDCCLGRGVCSISYENDFIYHYLIYFEKSWAKLSTGSTFDSVNSKQVKELEMPIPKSKEEQTRIAKILSDMDAELSALEQKLEKYKKVKLGMMQELLTGKTRLV
jgi:type I restriction enzyme S subunit